MLRRFLQLLLSRWALLVTGALLIYLYLDFSAATASRWLTFAILALVISVAQLIIASNPPGGHRAFGITMAFLFAGALLLSPLHFALLVFLPPSLQELTRKVNRLAIPLDDEARLFEPLNQVASGMTAGLVFRALDPAATWNYLSPVALGAAMLVFLLVHQALLALFGLFRRRRTATELKLTVRVWLLRDLFVLALGGAVVALWERNTWFGLTALVQLLLMYRVAQIPQLEKLAQTDEKTGLWNARHFNTLFAAEIERANRFGRPLAVVMTDLDLLRNVNNTYGHLAGDAVLREIGLLIRQSLREYDIAGRFGGEEFALVLPEAGPVEALTIAERLRGTIANNPFKVPTSATPIHVTMSLGVACFPGDGTASAELIQIADNALYAAKAQGRNRTLLAGQRARPPAESAPSTVAAPSAQPARPNWQTRLSTALGTGWMLAWNARRSVYAGALLALFVMGSLVFGAAGVVIAENALPGDSLYPVKTTIETIQLALTSDAPGRAAFESHLAQNRLDELATLMDLGRFNQIPATLQAYTHAVQSAAQVADDTLAHDPARAANLDQRVLLPLLQQVTILRSLQGRGPQSIQDAVTAALDSTQSQLNLVRASFALAQRNSSAPGSLTGPSARPTEPAIALAPTIAPPPATVSPVVKTSPMAPATLTAPVSPTPSSAVVGAVSGALPVVTGSVPPAKPSAQPQDSGSKNKSGGVSSPVTPSPSGQGSGGSRIPAPIPTPIAQPGSPQPAPRGPKGRQIYPCSAKKCTLPSSTGVSIRSESSQRREIEMALKRNAVSVKH